MTDHRTAEGLMARERIDRYLHETGLADRRARVVPLTGDASDRKYFRILQADAPSHVIALYAGAFDFTKLSFANVAELLDRVPLPVPTILRHSDELGIVAQEDLGDATQHAHLRAAPLRDPAAPHRQAAALPRPPPAV